MAHPIRSAAAGAVALLLFVPIRASSQGGGGTVACTGEIVSRVDIRPSPPPFSGTARKWQSAARAAGLHHATTQAGVIQAFLSLAPGQPCTEFRRAESERVLRAQPFLSDAIVFVLPDTGGRVAVLVTTTDEVPVLVSARFRGIAPESFGLGNENLFGSALRLEGHIERGRAYRTALSARLQQDALFGRPYRFIVDGGRFQLGQELAVELEHPFFTDLQRISWHGGFFSRDDYVRFARPARDPLGLQVRDRRWDASGLLRVFGTKTVALLGGAVTGRQFDPAAAGIVIDDTGFRADTGTTLRRRYSMFRATRIGVTTGLRRVSFRNVNGFDALDGSQDVASGMMLGLHAAHGLAQSGERDFLLSSAGYAGLSSRNALLATFAQFEARRDPTSGKWDSMIGSARTAFYWGSAPGVVLAVANELSGGSHSLLPLQLTFSDRTGGMLGYGNSPLAGAVRNVVRAEARWSGEAMVRKADVGIATFGEFGTLWAGDVPYGSNATRATVGVSLLAAYPSRAKRLYRADIGVPLSRGGVNGGRIEVRFSSVDRTQGFWKEPGDVARARTGTDPSQLFAWPSQ